MSAALHWIAVVNSSTMRASLSASAFASGAKRARSAASSAC
jgi:hypothetical protein